MFEAKVFQHFHGYFFLTLCKDSPFIIKTYSWNFILHIEQKSPFTFFFFYREELFTAVTQQGTVQLEKVLNWRGLRSDGTGSLRHRNLFYKPRLFNCGCASEMEAI